MAIFNGHEIDCYTASGIALHPDTGLPLQPFTRRALTSKRGLLSKIFISAWRGTLEETIPEITQRLSLDPTEVETAFFRLRRTIEVQDPFSVMSDLRLRFGSPVDSETHEVLT